MVDVAVGRPLVFNHIPKTAGTSIIQGLLAALRPAAPFIGYDRSVFGAFESFEQLSRRVRRGLVLQPEDIPAEADAVFGHLSPATTRARFPGASSFTLLREPRTRCISHWLFARAHTTFMFRGLGDWAEYVALARTPLAQYLEEPRVAFYTDNAITRHLLWPHPLIRPDGFIDPRDDEELLERAAESLALEFGFVGLVEDPGMHAALSAWIGRDIPLIKANESPRVRHGLEADIAAECDKAADLLAVRSRLDEQLWDRVASPGPVNAAEQRELAFRQAIVRYAQLQPVDLRSRLERVGRLRTYVRPPHRSSK